jgi:hypothetical protein
MDASGGEKGILWFWIGLHTTYDRLVKGKSEESDSPTTTTMQS